MASVSKVEQDTEGAFAHSEARPHVGNIGQLLDANIMGPLLLVLNDTITAVSCVGKMAGVHGCRAPGQARELLPRPLVVAEFVGGCHLRDSVGRLARGLAAARRPVRRTGIAPAGLRAGRFARHGRRRAWGHGGATFASLEKDRFEFVQLVTEVARMAGVCIGRLQQRAQGEAAVSEVSASATGVNLTATKPPFCGLASASSNCP